MFNKKTLNKIKGYLALTRVIEIYDYTIAVTLLAAMFAGNGWQWRIILIIVVNILTQCFAFMFNDVEDAQDDATNPKKLKRNPISNGTLTKKEGYLAAGLVALLSVFLFAILAIKYQPWAVIILAISTLVIMFLYSWKKIRFKSIPVVDMLSHIYMLAGAPFLLAFLCIKQSMNAFGWLGLAIVMIVSCYGVLENQIRDFETDRNTKIKNSASIIGLKKSKFIQLLFLIIGIVLILAYIYTLPQKLFVILQIALILIVLMLYPAIKYLITRDKERFKLDAHRVCLFAGYIILLIKILHII